MSNPLQDALNASAYSSQTSSGKEKTELTMKDIHDCTGSSRSILARALSRINVFLKTGTVITDAKVAEILNHNGAENIQKIAGIFKIQAAIINLNAEKSSMTHDVKQLKQDAKDLQRTVDLIKLFDTTAKPGFVSENLNKDLNEIEKAHLLVSSKNAMHKYPPTNLLKAALFENATLKEDARSQLGKDFLKYVTQQKNYPLSDENLAKVYEEFTKHTLASAASAKNPEEIKNQTAKLKEYIKPTIPVYAHMSLTLSGLAISNEHKTMARNFHSTDITLLLKSNLEKRKAFDEQLFGDLAKISSSTNDFKATAKQLQELLNRDFQGDSVLRTHIELSHSYEGVKFIDEILNLEGLSVDDKIQKMESIVATFITVRSPLEINIPQSIQLNAQMELDDVKTYVKNARALDTSEEEINKNLDEPNIFNSAGLHILKQIIDNSRIVHEDIKRNTGSVYSPVKNNIDFY